MALTFRPVMNRTFALCRIYNYSAKRCNKYPIAKTIEEQPTKQQHGYGSLAGQIFMSSDFDEPLEELEEYM